MTRPMAQIHGVAIALAVDPDGPLCGALLIGASGAGKSLLALDAIEGCPWRRTRLVADDRVNLAAASGMLVASAPPRLTGLLEVRGLGPIEVPVTASAQIRLVASLDGPFERTPETVAATYWPEELESGASACRPPRIAFQSAAIAPVARLRRAMRSILVDK